MKRAALLRGPETRHLVIVKSSYCDWPGCWESPEGAALLPGVVLPMPPPEGSEAELLSGEVPMPPPAGAPAEPAVPLPAGSVALLLDASGEAGGGGELPAALSAGGGAAVPVLSAAESCASR